MIRDALNSHTLLALFLVHHRVPLICLISGPSPHCELLCGEELCCHILYRNPFDVMMASSFKYVFFNRFQILIKISYCGFNWNCNKYTDNSGQN